MRTLAAGVCALLIAAGASTSASAAGLPTVEATMTIAGEVTGSQTVRFPGNPGEEGCPPFAPTSYTTTANLSAHVVYKKILIPLAKLSSPRPAARAGVEGRPGGAVPQRSLRLPVPTSSGGPGHGTFAFSGDFYRVGPNFEPCLVLQHYAFEAALSQSKKHKPHPIFTTAPPAFYYIGLAVDPLTIAAEPGSFQPPNLSEPQRVSENLPFYLPSDQLFFPAHGSKAVRVGWGEIGMEWNALQPKLRKLRHRSSITIPAVGSYSRSFRIEDTGMDGEDCLDAEQAPKNEPEPVTCNESTSAHYMVTIHRDRIFTVH